MIYRYKVAGLPQATVYRISYESRLIKRLKHKLLYRFTLFRDNPSAIVIGEQELGKWQ
jgi:hypothetical protein